MDQDTGDGLSRRDLLKSAAFGGVGLTLASSDTAMAQDATGQAASISGVVFEDKSGAGVRGADAPGLPGVLVSNGREVVKTDANGHYTLPLIDECVIFVIKPAGYAAPVDPVTMLHKFYRVHQPKGSPAGLT